MTLRFQYCTETHEASSNLDTMLFIVLEENNKEITKIPLYLDAEAMDLMPELKTSFKSLPSLIEAIYNSGKNNEEVIFKKEIIHIQ